jgi:16S rRNA (cytidine1402-2'-O)-methyltransferase
LNEVDFIFAEDTRTTGNLLKHYNIPASPRGATKLVSYNAHNQEAKNKELLRLLEEGKNIALVSDAGTPGISDPGYSAVRAVREHFLQIVSIPGPSALTAFVSILGAGTHAWTFYGFLPHKNGRQKMLKEMLASENSSIFYESTHRIEKCLQEILKLQAVDEKPRKVAVGKELTKVFEEVLVGTPDEILDIFKKDSQKKTGEGSYFKMIYE